MLYSERRCSASNFNDGNTNAFNVNDDGNAPDNNNVNNNNGVRLANFLITPIKKYITSIKIIL